MLQKILKSKKENIKSNIDKLFAKKYAKFKNTKKIDYPCMFKDCFFKRNKLARHLSSGCHQMDPQKSKLIESFLNDTLHHETLVVQKKVSKPIICHLCKLSFQRIGSHLINFYQMQRPSNIDKRALTKSSKVTKNFLNEYSKLKLTNDNAADINLLPHTQESSQASSISTIRKSVNQNKSNDTNSENLNSNLKSKAHEKPMTKLGSSTIRLRGVFDPPASSQQGEITVFKHKLPLTLESKRKYDIVDDSHFKFHDNSAEEVLDDFEHSLTTFKCLKEITSKQYMGDVKSIWMCVDPKLQLHPNQLVEPELVESRSFMLENVKLI